jgi:hydrogenase maturation factor
MASIDFEMSLGLSQLIPSSLKSQLSPSCPVCFRSMQWPQHCAKPSSTGTSQMTAAAPTPQDQQ